MNANQFAELVTEIIKSEPDEIIRLIEDEDWEGLNSEFYYAFGNAAEG